jgi:peptidoglycan/xylan/chitin deacetylase (PgdA/CDA1 family)
MRKTARNIFISLGFVILIAGVITACSRIPITDVAAGVSENSQTLKEQTSRREIALTFDDAPTEDTALFTGVARSEKILKTLIEADVPDALFFVIAKNLSETGKARISRYTEKGFHLAHHSFSHQSADQITQQDYLADFDKADHELTQLDNVLRLHRFPYLHYGKDMAAITALQNEITSRGYKDGYVTVDNFDWYFSDLITRAVAEGKTVDWDKARDIYVNTLYAGVEFYDAIARRVLNRSPRHVLLLHENDAAALFVGDLITYLRKNGWTIISPEQAYEDDIAKDFPETVFQKQGRIAAIAHSKGLAEAELRHPSESETYWNAAFLEAGVVIEPIKTNKLK